MTTYNITINERTAFGRDLIQRLSAMSEIKFEKAASTATKPENQPKKRVSNRKHVVLEEIRQSIRQADEMERNNSRTYTIEELLESL
ncbi:MAG: hypothetical protein KBT67_05925 [bacterium]|nr:hypothetical protein [Candidatus Limimorpha caballi]